MASWEEFSRIVAEAKTSKKLDPVGQEDDDVDNDGDSDSSDSYLKKRRATVGAAIAADRKKKVSEALDPVGQEDKDIDNDGDHDKSDKYLLNRRKVRAKVIPPQERLKTDRDMFNIPKSEQEAARERILAKAKAKRMKEEVEKIDESDIGDRTRRVVGDQRQGYHGDDDVLNKTRKKLDSPVLKPYPGGFPAFKGVSKPSVKTTQVAHFELEGEMVEEDKEYRREMRKAAARERAEEKTERKSEGKKSAKAPGRLGKSAGTSYADKEQLSIKGHDEVTKKSGHTIGNPFPENYVTNGEYIEEMPYQVYGSHDGKKEKKIGKPVKSRKYAHDRADELSDTHKETGGKFRVQKEENDLDEGMSMKDFKANRRKLKRKEASDDAKKRGHVGKEWYNSGRTYSPDEAKRGRAKMDDEERSTRKRSAIDPDAEDSDYSADKTKNPKKLRKQKAMGEGYLEEKSLSRAQQRFMGMVYAAKKGGTPASPEVAKAASGISKKAARDFAKTKHEGLPEKKEDTKEELCLVDRILLEVSDAQLMAAKARREERAKKYQGRLHQAKVATKANKMMRDEVKEKETPKEDKEKTKKEKAKEEVKTRNTATERAARTSAAGRVKAARIARETEKEKETARTERQRERLSYTEKSKKEREEKKAEQEKKREKRNAEKEAAKAKQSEAKSKQKELERKEKEKISQIKQKEQSRKKRRSELRSDIKSAWSRSIKVAGDKKDTEAVAAGVSNAASLAAGVVKTGVALGKYAYKKATEKKGEKGSEPSKSEKKEPVKSESKPETASTERVSAKTDEKKTDTTPKKLSGTPEERKKLIPSTKRLPAAGETGKPRRETGMRLGQRARRNPKLKSELIKSRMEEYSNWREEFIFEVDDQSIKEPQQKIIDVTKKKNKIEINPNMSEGCGCDEKEDAPKKDMRDLTTKVNLAKTKARLMGSRNPMMMVVSKEETGIEEGYDLSDYTCDEMYVNEDAGIISGLVGLALGAKGAYNAAKKTKRMRDYPKNFVKGIVDPRTYVPKKKKEQKEEFEIEEGMTMDDFKKQRRRQKEEPPVRKRGGISAPEDERSIGGQANRHNKDYWASVVGKNRDRGSGNKAKRRAAKLGESAAWTKKEGKSEAGGLNEKGRKSYERENPGSDLKAPSKEVGNPRRASFCARMSGMKAKLTSKKTANDPDSRINKSLRAWNC